MTQVRFLKGHTLYSYFAGDVVDVADLGAENAKKLQTMGFVEPVTGSGTKETPEDKLKPIDLDVRTGAEASPTPGEGLPASEPAPVANVPDEVRLGVNDKPVVAPEVDRNVTEGKPAKK